VYSALLDACVLHPWALCQLQLLIAEHGLFRPVWSGQILEETKRSIIRVHPEIEEERISKRIAAMRFAFEDAEVSDAQVRARLAAVPEAVPDHDRYVVAAALVVMALQTKRPVLSPNEVLALLERSVPSFVGIVRGSPDWVDASAGLEHAEESELPT
jgi:hypothetical protein